MKSDVTVNELWDWATDGLTKDYADAERVVKEICQEYDKALRSAIEDYLNEHSDPKPEYGPHGESIDWLHPEDVQEAIDKAEVEV